MKFYFYLSGFSVEDAMVILRTEQIFTESFDMTHVKTLKGDHMSRAIGRVAGSLLCFKVVNGFKVQFKCKVKYINLFSTYFEYKKSCISKSSSKAIEIPIY